MTARTKQITFYVDERTLLAVRRLAAGEHQVLSAYMRQLTERQVAGELVVASSDSQKLHFVYLGMDAILRFHREKELHSAVRSTHRIDTGGLTSVQ